MNPFHGLHEVSKEKLEYNCRKPTEEEEEQYDFHMSIPGGGLNLLKGTLWRDADETLKELATTLFPRCRADPPMAVLVFDGFLDSLLTIVRQHYLEQNEHVREALISPLVFVGPSTPMANYVGRDTFEVLIAY